MRHGIPLVLLLAGCSAAPAPGPVAERKVFLENEVEYRLGERILKEVAAGALTEDPVGRTAVFTGNGNAINHDLKTAEGVRVVVDLDPPIDKRPGTILWKAAVLGRIEAIDLGRRVIRVSAAPVNWKPTQTW